MSLAKNPDPEAGVTACDRSRELAADQERYRAGAQVRELLHFPWVSIADALPDEDEFVLVSLADGYVCIGRRSAFYRDGYHGDLLWQSMMAGSLVTHKFGPAFPVTHWAPLPAPPHPL